MKALSILQPWAWLIVHGYKDIENRSWYTPVRGRILVHTGRTYSQRTHREYAWALAGYRDIKLPPFEEMPRGAIVGAVDIVDCVKSHSSYWKDPYGWGFVLANAKALSTPTPYRGQLSFFEISHITDLVELFGGDSPG